MKKPSAPVLPGLYPDIFSKAEVNRQRDEAMAQVIDNVAAPDFGARAADYILKYLSLHGPTSGEQLTVACKSVGIRAHDDRAFGPVYMQLARSRQIEKVGMTRRERGHGTAGGNIWQINSHSI